VSKVENLIDVSSEDSEFVTVSFGADDVKDKTDSGTDVSVVHPSCIPSGVLYNARQSGDVGAVRDVKLMGAFVGVGVSAELMHLPCTLVGKGNK